MAPGRLIRTSLGLGAFAALVACGEHASSPTSIRTSTLTPSLGIFLPNGGTANTAQIERLEVCKVYVMTSGAQPPAATNFTVNGPGTVNGAFTLAPNTCREVWVGNNESVTVTEETMTGFTQTCQRTLLNGSSAACTSGTEATSFLAGSTPGAGELVVFTNTEVVIPPPPPSAEGRMTGGGVQFYGDARISRGFTIHCDITLSNNLEINWPGNKWHLNKPLTSAFCFDDPNVDHGPPAAPFDTFVGEGVGRLNGVDGALVKFTFVDAGEPGKNDKTQIQIWAPDGTLVLDTPLSTLVHGNIQAHYDQPHGSKP
jgi:hypothetical protein